MTFLVTFVLTFLLILGALLYFWAKGSPFYRVEKDNVIRLLELVESEQATDNDWQVFIAHPIRHDPVLAEIQQRCIDISEREYLGNSSRLFSRKGLDELSAILRELRHL